MSILSKTKQVPKVIWVALIGAAVAGSLLGLRSYATSVYHAKEQNAYTAVTAEAKTGGHVLAAKAMREFPALWHKKAFSVNELNVLIASNALTSVGLVDELSSGNGLAEILVTTKFGNLGYVKDTGRELLTAKLLENAPDKLSVSRIEWDRPTSFWSTVGTVLSKLFLPLLLLVLLLGPRLSARSKLVPLKSVTTRFADVVGVADAKAALQDIMDFMKDPSHYTKVGAKPTRGVLLSGPPGTGKTLLAKALAGECGVSFISCSGADFSSPLYGMGISKVKRLFEAARKEGKCIIFIDEIDGIGQRTTSGRGPEASEFNRIINQFLVEMDGFTADERIVVIGATNLTNNVDPALLRDGRFDRKIELQLPTLDERTALFDLYCSKLALAPEVGFTQLARMTFGLSPAAIANVVNQAAVRAARERASEVSFRHLAEAIEVAHLGEASGIELGAEERYRTAVHEAGHAVMVVKHNTGNLEKVTVMPRGGALGLTFASHDEKVYLRTKESLQHLLEMLLAGRAAEEVVLGSPSIGASDDLRKATEIATAMVAKYGYGDGLAVLQPEQLQAKSTLDRVNDLLDQRYQATLAAIREHKAVLTQVTDRLLAEETIDGQVVRELMAA